MIKIQQLKSSNATVLRDLNALLFQLSASASHISPTDLRRLIANKNIHIAVALDGRKIIGTATLVFIATLTRKSATIEDVVVDAAYRGRGIGEKLTRHLLKVAKTGKAALVDLTSKPSRIAANALYQKLGFELRDTNVYRKKLRS